MRWLGVVVVVGLLGACVDAKHKENVDCCGCLGRQSKEDGTTKCVPDSGECTAALDNGDNIQTNDFCLGTQCPQECSFLGNAGQ